MSPISRRHLVLAATTAAAVAAAPRFVFAQATAQAPAGPFKIDPLTYPTNALEPHIDARTMEIHHDRHHQAYVTNLNNFAKDNPQIAEKPITDVLANLGSVPETIRTGVRNNMGGHANHTMFWQIMGPGGGKPDGEVARLAGGMLWFAAYDVIEDGRPRTLEFGVADETAWRAGLSCGGRIRVFVERID